MVDEPYPDVLPSTLRRLAKPSIPALGVYQVTPVDKTGQPMGHREGAVYIVLDMFNDKHARQAAKEYAFSIQEEDPELAVRILLTIDSIEDAELQSRKFNRAGQEAPDKSS